MSLLKLSWIVLLLALSHSADAEMDAALAEIRSEVKVRGVHYDDTSGVLSVGVFDDGSKRDGYAMYVCELLREHAPDKREILIKIVDAPKLTVRGEFQELGRFVCKTR